MSLPNTENALLLRTDFSDQAAWEKIRVLVRKPGWLWGGGRCARTNRRRVSVDLAPTE